MQLDSIRIKNLNYKRFRSFTKSIAIDKNFVDVQFFPEGGKLINGLTNTIRFKALDYNNKGILIKGRIEEENGTKITEFKSNDLGMGMFQFQPNFRKNYFAQILSKDTITYKFKLPKIYEKGFVLIIKSQLDFFRLQLSSNFSKNDSIAVKVQARGLTYYHFKSKCKEGKINMSFKRDLFPEGIITFTFYDSNNLPICERLVFNYKEKSERLKKRLKISTKSNKKRYQQRDKLVFDVNISNNNQNSNTNTSFLVLNKTQLGKMHLDRSNILSYFLLESELKGTIERPQFYFDINNKERFYAMDALMLTQGWRNYILKANDDKTIFKYQPEKNLQIAGTIEEYTQQKRKRKKPIELTLMTLDKKNLQASVTNMDSLGRFSFNLKDSYTEDLEYLIQTTNHKGRKKALTVKIDKPKPLLINFKTQEKLQLADEFKVYVNENIKRYAKENPFTVDENGFTLDEVVVKRDSYLLFKNK